jgi:hypothetical protein
MATTTELPVFPLGEHLHKALRQACSSQAAYLLWLLLNGTDEDAQAFWSCFIARLRFRVSLRLALDATPAFLKEIVGEMPHKKYGATAIRVAFLMIPDSDLALLGARINESFLANT